MTRFLLNKFMAYYINAEKLLLYCKTKSLENTRTHVRFIKTFFFVGKIDFQQYCDNMRTFFHNFEWFVIFFFERD